MGAAKWNQQEAKQFKSNKITRNKLFEFIKNKRIYLSSHICFHATGLTLLEKAFAGDSSEQAKGGDCWRSFRNTIHCTWKTHSWANFPSFEIASAWKVSVDSLLLLFKHAQMSRKRSFNSLILTPQKSSWAIINKSVLSSHAQPFLSANVEESQTQWNYFFVSRFTFCIHCDDLNAFHPCCFALYVLSIQLLDIVYNSIHTMTHGND